MEAESIQSALSEAGFWPQPGPVETIETHISRLFLVGDRVYKVKKPLDLGFADFSTLEKRRFYCEEEFRLNRRHAPELYLGIRRITGTPDHPEFDGNGEPIEYAVEMQRFDQKELMENVEGAGKLTRDHMEQLARVVAAFHDDAPPAGPEDFFGDPGVIAEPVEENFRHLQENLPEECQSRLHRLRSHSLEEHRNLRQTFAARKAQGRIRECHGDLHLGNMILRDGKITIFDCIEFNPALRWIDVLSDIAFCAMDLTSRGHGDLAHTLLNGYLENTGDYGGLPVLPFYLGYRAMVRAKVASIRIREEPEEGRSALRDEWERYLRLAETYAFERKPQLILMHGVSGTGKSYGSREIIEKLGAIRIRSDVERKRLAPGVGTDELYSREMSERTYERLRGAAAAGLKAGFPVILDAAFLEHEHRAVVLALARQWNVPCRILDVTAAEATLRRRIEERQAKANDPSDADLSVLDKQIASREPLTPSEQELAIPVDTERPDCWSEAVRRLLSE